MLDEQRVERDPVPRRDDRPQALLGRLRAGGPHDAEPVGDPVHVGVDRDRRDPVAEDEHAVRGLRPDAAEPDELVVRPRDLAAVPLEDRPRDVADHAALRPVEPDRTQDRAQVPLGGVGEAPRVGIAGEQIGRGAVGVGVPGPLREDRADQHLERVLGVVAEVRPAPVPRAVERRQPVEQELPVEPGRGRLRRGHRRFRPGAGLAGTGGGPWPGSLRSGSSVASGSRRSSPTR